MSKYVVLGSNGFLGRSFCERVVSYGHEVRLIPRDMYGNVYALKAYLEAENPDFIINFAAYGNHNHQNDTHAIFEANVMDPLHLLEASLHIPYKGLVLVGSSSEYGITDLPMSEKDPLNPTTFYGGSKVAQSVLAKVFASNWKKPIVVVRPFSVYGPGEAPFRFIPTVIQSLSQDQPFKLSPKATHDWIYIDDFIDGILRILKNHTLLKGQPVNLGTGVCWSNLEIVKILELIAGKKGNYTIVDGLRSYDSLLWVADMHYPSRRFGINPRLFTSLVDGLQRTYDHYC